MNKADAYYYRNLELILEKGCLDENPRPCYKDGVPAHSKFITGVFEEYDISKNEFPIPTLRNTAIKTGIKEILWIYQKQSNSLDVAREMGINWWDEWDVGDNTIGHRYGHTIRENSLVDTLLHDLVHNPFSRRHIINLYQYSALKETTGLFPCAYETLWSVRKEDNEFYLDLTLVQRSNDYIMAGYINKIQYTGLMLMLCSHTGYKPGMFRHLTQNLHIYDRHFDAAYEILNKRSLDTQPILKLNGNKSFYDISIDDFVVSGLDRISKIESPLELAI